MKKGCPLKIKTKNSGKRGVRKGGWIVEQKRTDREKGFCTLRDVPNSLEVKGESRRGGEFLEWTWLEVEGFSHHSSPVARRGCRWGKFIEGGRREGGFYLFSQV